MRRLHLFLLTFLALYTDWAMAEPVTAFAATTFGKTLLSGVASGLVGSIFGGGNKGQQQQQAAPPPVEAPTVMPVADDAAAQAAKKKSIAAQIQRRGRASTILTGGETETMGA
jgi:hypothetical protein